MRRRRLLRMMSACARRAKAATAEHRNLTPWSISLRSGGPVNGDVRRQEEDEALVLGLGVLFLWGVKKLADVRGRGFAWTWVYIGSTVAEGSQSQPPNREKGS
jgi:hypothetical protein